MLTDVRVWRRYPILAMIRFMQNTIRTTALLFFVMVISLISTSKKITDLPVGFIGISLGLNWLLMIYFGAKLKRYKIWAYPLMFVVNPFFNWWYMVYGIFTAGQRTWGGPRADAGAADATTTPQQVIEKADAAGDELNVVPETFKPAAEARRNQISRKPVPLQPPEKLEGRFAAAEKLPGGWYEQVNDSLMSVGPGGALTGPSRNPMQSRDSFDSGLSARTSNNSVYMPRRVQSIMGEEDRKKYAMAQANQRAAGGAYMTGHLQDQGLEMSDEKPQTEEFKDSGAHFGRQDHSRANSYNSLASADGSSTDTSPPLEPSAVTGTLTSPQASTKGGRTARSPLGRASLIRTVPNDGSAIELQEELQQPSPPHPPPNP